MVNATPRPLYLRETELITNLQNIGLDGFGKVTSTGIRSPEHLAPIELQYCLSYPGPRVILIKVQKLLLNATITFSSFSSSICLPFVVRYWMNRHMKCITIFIFSYSQNFSIVRLHLHLPVRSKLFFLIEAGKQQTSSSQITTKNLTSSLHRLQQKCDTHSARPAISVYISWFCYTFGALIKTTWLVRFLYGHHRSEDTNILSERSLYIPYNNILKRVFLCVIQVTCQ